MAKKLVLKALAASLASRKDLVARLRQEWRALGRLNHPNIINVTDAGATPAGVPFYVMEHVGGKTLADVMRGRRLSVRRSVKLVVQVLDGLAAAHAIGIVHRDVKPPNLLVAADGAVKLLDFGVAKIVDSHAEVITARGVTVGTPRYMSPEQARGEKVDGRAGPLCRRSDTFRNVGGARALRSRERCQRVVARPPELGASALARAVP